MGLKAQYKSSSLCPHNCILYKNIPTVLCDMYLYFNHYYVVIHLFLLFVSNHYIYLLYYYLRGCPCLDWIFFVQNTPISLSLSRDKTKGQQSKNTSLTYTKILPTKYDYSSTNPLIQKQTSRLNFFLSLFF